LNSNFPLAAADVSKLLKANGIQADQEKLDLLVSKLSGKPLHELISSGLSKVTTAAAAPAAAAGGAPAPSKSSEPEPPKEEKAAVDIGNVFGDDDEDY
jgi:ribosomal protein L12E/L44/L45/RPP1/RPP2